MEDLEDEAYNAGVYPYLPEQDLGGWCYERAFFEARYKPSEYLVGDALERYYNETLLPMLEALEEILQPTYEDHLAYAGAMELFVAQERFGLRADEDSIAMYMTDCLRTARDRAEDLSNRERALESQRQSSEAQSSSQQQVDSYDVQDYSYG